MIFLLSIKRNSRSGMSLIEIMFAFLIMVLAALSASSAIGYGVRGTQADFRQIEAMQLLIDRMNEITSLPFARLDSFLESAGEDEVTFNNEIEGMVFGDSVEIGANHYRIHATLKRQTVVFESLMELDFPNPSYDPQNPSTWRFRDRPDVALDGSTNPYAVIKTTVVVQPVGGQTEEREFQAISFVADFES